MTDLPTKLTDMREALSHGEAGNFYTAEELAQHMENDCMIVGYDDVPAMLRKQADELERLSAENDALTEALANSCNRRIYSAPPGMVFVEAGSIEKLTAENARLNVALEHVEAGLRAAEEERDALRKESQEHDDYVSATAADIAERDDTIERLAASEAKWRSKYHECRKYLRAANRGASTLAKVVQLQAARSVIDATKGQT